MFSLGADQQLLEESTGRFLDAECPLATVRALATDPAGYDPNVWRRGAALGWTSLVVPAAAGGGSVSAHGAADLASIAYQFGLHAAPGPLLGTNLVVAALGRWGGDDQRTGPLAELLRGDAVGAWAHTGPPPDDRLGHVTLREIPVADGYRLDGTASPVEVAALDLAAARCHLLVAAAVGPELSQFLLPADALGVTVAPLESLDVTKRFVRLEFDGTPVSASSLVGAPGTAGPAIAWLTDLAVTIQLAEMCGAMRWALDTTLAWTFDRFTFGRPLASYQEIKHRVADMTMWLEASEAITARTSVAVADDAPERSELRAGKFYVGRYGVELVQDCVQLHGGIGVTYDHDLHLFLRRVVTSAPLHGSSRQHVARLGDMVEAREAAG